jgi:hypothetical protein
MTVFQPATSTPTLALADLPREEHSDESDVDGPQVASSLRRGPVRTARAVHVSEIPKTNRTKYYVLDLTAIFRYMVCGYQVHGKFASIPSSPSAKFNGVQVQEGVLSNWDTLRGFIGEESRTLSDIVCFLAARLNLCHRLQQSSRPSTRPRGVEQGHFKPASRLFIPFFGDLARVVASTLACGPTVFHTYELKRPLLMPANDGCKKCSQNREPCGSQCELLHRLVFAKSKLLINYPQPTQSRMKEEVLDLSQNTAFLLSQEFNEDEVAPNNPEPDDIEKQTDDLLADLGAMWKRWGEGESDT